MKALRWHNRGDVRFEEVEDPPAPQPEEIRLEVEACGICGTDVEEYTSGPIVIPISPHPLTGFRAPMIIGHEVAGRIKDVGKNVKVLHPGQLVGLDGSFFCGSCAACRRHQPNLCERWAFIGMSYPGGLAEEMTVPAYMAVPIPDIPAEWAALAETFSVATRALRRGGLTNGETVVVFGAGPVGLAVLQVAQALGARRVTVVDPSSFRRGKARELGAQAVLGSAESLVDVLCDLEHGGPDLIIECSGDRTMSGLAILAVRPGGRVVQVGLPPLPGELDLLQLALREVELIGSVGHVYDEDYRRAVELIVSKRVDARPLITHRLSLAEAVPRGLALLASKSVPDALKIIVAPRGV